MTTYFITEGVQGPEGPQGATGPAGPSSGDGNVSEERFIDLANGYDLVQAATQSFISSADLGGDDLDPSSDLDPDGGFNLVMGGMEIGFAGALNSPTAPPIDGALLVGVRVKGVEVVIGEQSGTLLSLAIPTPGNTGVFSGVTLIEGLGADDWTFPPGSLAAQPTTQPSDPVDVTFILDEPILDYGSIPGLGIASTPTGAPPWTPVTSVSADSVEWLWAMPEDAGPTIPTATQLVLTDFGAVGDGVADDTEAFEAAAAALASGPIKLLFIPAGTYSIRRPFEVPGGCTVYGVKGKSIIQRYGAGAKAQITEDIFGSTTVIPVDDSTGFSVGDCVLIFDTGNTDWVATFANVVSLTSTTISIDRELNSSYIASLDAAVWRSFPFVANTPYHGDDPEPTSTEEITLRDFDIQAPGIGATEPENLFVNAAVHMVQVLNVTLDGIRVKDATTDAISVQGRFPGTPEGEAYPANALIHNCSVEGAGRHGIHLGTAHSGVRVIGNDVADCDDMGLFLCMNVQDTIISNNVFRNCRQGIAGGDVRERNGNPLTTSIPLNDITGDVRCTIANNTFIGGEKSHSLGAVQAITACAQFSVTGNIIRDWITGIVLVPWALDAVVSNNVISTSEYYAGGVGIVVMPGCYRSRVTDNILRGGVGENVLLKNDMGFQIEGPHDDVLISGNSVTDFSNGVVIGPMNEGDVIRGMKFINNTIRRVAIGGFPIKVYGDLEDCHIDLTGIDMSDSVLYTGVIDIEAGVTTDRVLINGLGNNGSVDPATGGPWNTLAADGRYQGVEVAWMDDVTPRISRWLGGLGWITVV